MARVREAGRDDLKVKGGLNDRQAAAVYDWFRDAGAEEGAKTEDRKES